MLGLKYSSHFKKDFKSYKYNKVVLSELEKVVRLLCQSESLSLKCANHRLRGGFEGCFECHIRPDVLLIYKVKEGDVLILLRLGSHADIFGC